MNTQTQGQTYFELSRNEVAHRARRLWEENGRPAGRNLEYWLQAEVELLASQLGRVPEEGSVSGRRWPGIVSADKGHRSKRWN